MSQDKGSILVVDDTPNTLGLLLRLLSSRGYHVHDATNGPAALEFVQANPPDLILLDINMPEMSGYEVCERLRADANTRDIPVIFISALDDTKDKLKGFEVGGTDYITKPFEIEEVLARVRVHMDLREAQKGLQRQTALQKRLNKELARLNDEFTSEIAQHKRTEEKLRKFSRAVEQTASTIIITDLTGVIEFVNPAFSVTTGYTPEEVIGQHIRLLKSGHHPPEFYTAMWETLRSKEMWRGEFYNKRKSGELYWEFATISPIKNEAGHITHYLAVKDDITRLKQTESALRQRTSELESRNAELDAYAHTVAHDLKNLLNAVMVSAEMLVQYVERMDTGQLQATARAVGEGMSKAVDIVNNLLLLTSAHKMQVQTRVLDMGGVVAEAQHRLANKIEEYRSTIIQPESWPAALGYAPWVEEVWVNYLSNALKYGGDPPYIELGADILPNPPLPATEGRGRLEVGMVRFWVRDNGQGLLLKEQERLFTPFERLGQVRIEGHGLG